MAAARRPSAPVGWCDAAVDAVVRWAVLAGQPDYAVRLIAQGAVALLAALGARGGADRQRVLDAAARGDDIPALLFVREELAWRLEAL